MRCQRENLECWSRWDAAFYQMQRKDKNRRLCRKFLFWLIWGGQDLIKDNDEEAISHLLLEPMYWLEESACAQKGAL